MICSLDAMYMCQCVSLTYDQFQCVITLACLDLWPLVLLPSPNVPASIFRCPKPTIHVQCVRLTALTWSGHVGPVWWVLEFKGWCLYLTELDDGQRVEKIKDLLSPLPRCVLVVMRYLFAFLNQWVPPIDKYYIKPDYIC